MILKILTSFGIKSHPLVAYSWTALSVSEQAVEWNWKETEQLHHTSPTQLHACTFAWALVQCFMFNNSWHLLGLKYFPQRPHIKKVTPDITTNQNKSYFAHDETKVGYYFYDVNILGGRNRLLSEIYST